MFFPFCLPKFGQKIVARSSRVARVVPTRTVEGRDSRRSRQTVSPHGWIARKSPSHPFNTWFSALSIITYLANHFLLNEHSFCCSMCCTDRFVDHQVVSNLTHLFVGCWLWSVHVLLKIPDTTVIKVGFCQARGSSSPLVFLVQLLVLSLFVRLFVFLFVCYCLLVSWLDI